MPFRFERGKDARNMFDDIRSWPEQLRAGWDQGQASARDRGATPSPRALIWAGMGGSAIAGDYLAELLSDQAPFPVFVHRGGPFPAWAREDTAVILASYSGGTAETLATAGEASRRGCRLYALTSGGRLGALANEAGFERWPVHGGRMPRAALGEAFATALGAFREHGWVTVDSRDFDQTVSTLENLNEGLSREPADTGHPLSVLLKDLVNKHGMIYGSGALAPAARRWAAQINENAKRAAQWGVMPEMNHNEVVPYVEGGPWGQWYTVILLDDPGAPEDVRTRIPITAGLAREAGWNAHVLTPKSDSTLSRMLEMTLFGDWLSYWLALAQGMDPSPIPTIDLLKVKLKHA